MPDSTTPWTTGILQATILEWVAFPCSRGSSQPRNWIPVSHTVGSCFFFFFNQLSHQGSPPILQAVSLPAVQFSHCCVWLSATPWTAARQAPLCITNSRSLLKLMFRAGDAIQLCHPLSPPSPPAPNPSQHQGLFKWVSSLHQVVKVLEFQLQHQSFQWTPRTDLL